MQITATYQLSLDELKRGTKAISAKRRAIVWVLAAISAAIGIIDLVVAPSPVAGICVAIALTYTFLLTIGSNRAVAKQAHRLCVPTEATFTAETFATRSPLGSTEYRWQALTKVAENSEFFLLYITARAAVLIPKRAFAPADADQMSSFLKNVTLAAPQGRKKISA